MSVLKGMALYQWSTEKWGRSPKSLGGRSSEKTTTSCFPTNCVAMVSQHGEKGWSSQPYKMVYSHGRRWSFQYTNYLVLNSLAWEIFVFFIACLFWFRCRRKLDSYMCFFRTKLLRNSIHACKVHAHSVVSPLRTVFRHHLSLTQEYRMS